MSIDIMGIPTKIMLPIGSSQHSKGRVIILGNAFGVMPYQPLLGCELAEKGYEAWWFAYRGQDGTPGVFTGLSGADDLRQVFSCAREYQEKQSFSVISHCASGLILAEYFRRYEAQNVTNVIFYGFLYKPSRRRKTSIQGFRKYNTKTAFNDSAWHYDPLPGLQKAGVPMLFCHAEDKINRLRASRTEIEVLAEQCGTATIEWFKEGYDQATDNISIFVDKYISWLQKYQ